MNHWRATCVEIAQAWFGGGADGKGLGNRDLAGDLPDFERITS